MHQDNHILSTSWTYSWNTCILPKLTRPVNVTMAWQRCLQFSFRIPGQNANILARGKNQHLQPPDLGSCSAYYQFVPLEMSYNDEFWVASHRQEVTKLCIIIIGSSKYYMPHSIPTVSRCKSVLYWYTFGVVLSQEFIINMIFSSRIQATSH